MMDALQSSLKKRQKEIEKSNLPNLTQGWGKAVTVCEEFGKVFYYKESKRKCNFSKYKTTKALLDAIFNRDNALTEENVIKILSKQKKRLNNVS